MRIASWGFNLVLAVVAFHLAVGPAPAAEEKKKEKKPKQVKTLRIYVEARRDLPERTLTATLGQPAKVQFQVEKLPILNEDQLVGSSLLDVPGGYEIQLKFNSLGARVLESYTAAAVGRHLALLTEIDGNARWIAAPLIRQRLGDGILRFAPDTTREEAERIAQGLAKLIEKNRKQWLSQ